MREKVVIALRDKFPGETCWIVGKGPSLRHLRADHFGAGPVITINESILIVQEFGLSNPIYSMQKDGCNLAVLGNRCAGECEMKRRMVYPHEDVTAILQYPEYSENCMPKHELKLYVDPIEDLGFQSTAEMSIRMCVAIAKIMGCGEVVFMCCDSLEGIFETYNPRTEEFTDLVSGHYAYVAPQIMEDVKEMPHWIVTPQMEGSLC